MQFTCFIVLITALNERNIFQLASDICLLFLCLQVLIDWINDVLVEERIIVKQLEEDLYDGQVLQKLLGESSPQKVTPKTGRAQN